MNKRTTTSVLSSSEHYGNRPESPSASAGGVSKRVVRMRRTKRFPPTWWGAIVSARLLCDRALELPDTTRTVHGDLSLDILIVPLLTHYLFSRGRVTHPTVCGVGEPFSSPGWSALTCFVAARLLSPGPRWPPACRAPRRSVAQIAAVGELRQCYQKDSVVEARHDHPPPFPAPRPRAGDPGELAPRTISPPGCLVARLPGRPPRVDLRVIFE